MQTKQEALRKFYLFEQSWQETKPKGWLESVSGSPGFSEIAVGLAGGQGFGEVLRGPENYVLRFSVIIAYWLILQELWQTLNICITHFATMSYSNSEH
jgi:hypothetical protein